MRGRLGAAEQFQLGVAEEVRLRADALRVLEHQHGHVVVVVGGDPGGAHQPVADDLGAAAGAGQRAFQGGDALVEVLVPPLDQAVGVEDGRGTGGERDRGGAVHPAAGAERGPGGFLRADDLAAGVPDQDRQVARRGVDQAALVGVVHRVDAGGDLVGVDLGGQAVQQLEHLVRREVEAGVGADGGAQLAHHGGGAHPAAHDVADDQGRAAAAQGDHVVPVAADRGLGAAGVVRGGDAQVVGLLEFLREQGALEGHRGLALPALAGPQPLGRLGVVGDVRGEDQDAAVPFALDGDGGAGEGVAAAVGGRAGLEGARPGAAQDLVEEREQARLGQLGELLAGRFPRGAVAEGRGVGGVDVGHPVVGAVHQGDQGGDAVQDLVDGEVADGRGAGVAAPAGLFGPGSGDGAVDPPVLGGAVG
jgi:hypothetical protein